MWDFSLAANQGDTAFITIARLPWCALKKSSTHLSLKCFSQRELKFQLLRAGSGPRATYWGHLCLCLSLLRWFERGVKEDWTATTQQRRRFNHVTLTTHFVSQSFFVCFLILNYLINWKSCFWVNFSCNAGLLKHLLAVEILDLDQFSNFPIEVRTLTASSLVVWPGFQDHSTQSFDLIAIGLAWLIKRI